jgi:hypothetical protein
MPNRLSSKRIISLTVIVLLVSTLYSPHHIRTQKQRLLDTMILGADQLSRSITSATWRAMLADHRADAYEVMRLIGEKQGIDRAAVDAGAAAISAKGLLTNMVVIPQPRPELLSEMT